MSELRSEAERRRVLEDARVVAVLGAHPDDARPAHYVPEYLHQMGYRILPVNPDFAGQTLWGEVIVASVLELKEPVDLVDVFRRASAIPAHVPDLLAMKPLPRVVWFQLGIRNDAAARDLMAAGIEVVQDACTLADHRRFGLGKK